MELAGSILGVVDLCIKYGTILVNVCKAYRSADESLREAVLKLEGHWLKIQVQLEFLRKIWPSLSDDYKLHQNTVLQVLQGKIVTATALVDGLIGKEIEEPSAKTLKSKRGEARRLKYAVLAKEGLDAALLDLKDWSEVFDMSWFLIIRQSDKAIDRELKPVQASGSTSLTSLKHLRDAIQSTKQTDEEKSTVFISTESFTSTATRLEHSSAEVWHSLDGEESFVVDSPNDKSSLATICALAKRLKKIEAVELGILKCSGVLKLPPATDSRNNCSTRFVFPLPATLAEPQSLRALILSGNVASTLDGRFSLAKQLAKAVMFLHSTGFVHKNIRPETILVLQDEQREPHAILTGFEYFRLEEGQTLQQGDELWETNLYRHPTRQGTRPEEMYSMQHDIYSLGVCLLEIGLADSLVQFDASGGPIPSRLMTDQAPAPPEGKRRKPSVTKQALVRIAETSLPVKMGRKYASTVVTCLTCLDRTENSFGTESEFLDENGLLVGVRFIEKVSGCTN
jgi:serine/threonine protein kinase